MFNGMMSGVQGGNFWSGFAAGALSSIAASAFGQGYNHEGIDANGDMINPTRVWGGAGSLSTNPIGTLAFGAVAGGGGAYLAGGNFWQGAVTGLVVSGFNHLMHSVAQKIKISRLDKLLISNGYDPNAEANIYQSQINEFATEIFPDTMEKLGSPYIKLVDKIQSGNGEYAYGSTPASSNDGIHYKPTGTINISRSALVTYRLLASTIGHELNHFYHFATGKYDNWLKKYGHEKADAMGEWAAQKWEQAMGGFPTQSIINSSFKIMTNH